MTARVTGGGGCVPARLETAFTEGWEQVVAAVTRLTGDRELAQECAQEAFERALVRWPADGIPDSPQGWLITTARHLAVDRERRARVEAGKLRLLGQPEGSAADDPAVTAAIDGLHDGAGIDDESLELMLACAHPALAEGPQAELILSALSPLTAADIGHAFVTGERAMRQRLFRARRRLKSSGIPLGTPEPRLVPQRIPAVMHAIYLMFSAGYGAPDGTPGASPRLERDALRLARALAAAVPGEPEAQALLALLVLHHARRDARMGEAGGPALLAEQDRSRWHQPEIAEGLALARAVQRSAAPGPFAIQAAIAAVHAAAPSAAGTDWARIAFLCEQLARVTPREAAVSVLASHVAMADSPEAGLLIAVDPPDSHGAYQFPPGVQAWILRRAGRWAEAVGAWQEALDLAPALALARAGAGVPLGVVP